MRNTRRDDGRHARGDDSMNCARTLIFACAALAAAAPAARAQHWGHERTPHDGAGMRSYRSHIIDDGWSEVKVREALRESPEYRQKTMMTYPKAQEVVRHAYLNVLKREPDSGASGYINHVLRDHWTQADVERELRKSPEYRKGK